MGICLRRENREERKELSAMVNLDATRGGRSVPAQKANRKKFGNTRPAASLG